MIPKLIHLCWLSGDPYPPKIQYCIDSWKRYLPDYEVMLWDTKRFDVNSIPWTKEAFEVHNYAFVSDFIRLFAVYNYGGIYLDSDVEVIKSFDDLLDLPYFLGSEIKPSRPELAAFGAEKGNLWVKEAMDHYLTRNLFNESGEVIVEDIPTIMETLFHEKYQWRPINGLSEFDPDPSIICVLPVEWFNAHPCKEGKGLEYLITDNTHCIHHFAGSWYDLPYEGGLLHKLYYKITGKNWKFSDKRFRLYGKSKKSQ